MESRLCCILFAFFGSAAYPSPITTTQTDEAILYYVYMALEVKKTYKILAVLYPRDLRSWGIQCFGFEQFATLQGRH